MRILHVIASLGSRYGGPSKACFEMARSVAALGHTVSIYTTDLGGPTDMCEPPSYKTIIREGVEIRYFPVQRPHFWRFSLPLARALRANIREYDVVHIHSLYLFHNLVAGHYCRKYNVPYLIRPHGTLDPLIFNRHRLRKSVMEVAFEHKNIKHAAAIHFTTEEEKRLAEPYTSGAPAVVVPNGLDLSEYENLPIAGTFKSQNPQVDGKKIILFLGRINFKKGLDILAQAYSTVARTREDVHLVIAGPDNDKFGDKVRAWLKDWKVHDRTTFTGMLLGEDKLAAFRDAEVFVLPSYSENFGIAVVEAMACSLPVVISDKVNIWQEVEAGEAGKVAPCEAPRFAEAMLSLLDNPDLAKQMGENGKALVSEQFQWSSAALKMEETYRSILAGGATAISEKGMGK